MSFLVGIPVLLVLVMLQSAIVSTLPLLHGSADLILLVLVAWSLQERVPSSYEWAVLGGVMSGAITKLPFYVPLIGYLAAAALARFLRQQVWQTPFFAMFITTFLSTIMFYLISWSILVIQGMPLPFLESMNLVVLPAALLNLILALPVYVVVTDLAQSIYPEEVDA
jgi:rod shape-determining protein MreD